MGGRQVSETWWGEPQRGPGQSAAAGPSAHQPDEYAEVLRELGLQDHEIEERIANFSAPVLIAGYESDHLVRLAEQYSEVLRELGLQDHEIDERIANFTVPMPNAVHNPIRAARRHDPGPSDYELKEELEQALLASGIPLAEVGPIGERFLAGLVRRPEPEERDLRPEIENALRDLGLPPDSWAPPPPKQ